MEYKKKITALFSVIAALALVYTASFIFNPESSSSRNASYTWFDSKLSGRVTRIVLTQPNSGAEEKTEIIKNNNKWFVLNNGKEYPARQLRIDDFINIFTTRAAWSVRSSSESSHARLGLNTETASRVTIYGENSTLLDLLIGAGDSTGREIYLRKYGQNEVRSGEDKISSYLGVAKSWYNLRLIPESDSTLLDLLIGAGDSTGREIYLRKYGQNEVRSGEDKISSYLGSAKSWYNLRLIPESEEGKTVLNGVQRLSVYTSAGQQIFSLNNKEWIISGFVVEKPDQSKISSYINSVINIEGDEFTDSVSSNDPMFNNNRVVLEFGNGNIRTIRISESDENGKRYASVTPSDFVYSISPWAVQTLFKNASDFEMQQE